MISPGSLLLGLAVAAPVLWSSVMHGSVAVDVALQRLLLILLVTAVGWTALQRLVHGFARSAASSDKTSDPQGRRRDDS